MARKYNILITDEFKFVNFSDILMDIRDLFLDDLCKFEVNYPIKINSRFNRKYSTNSTIENILQLYTEVDHYRTLVIVLPTDIEFTSGGLFVNDDTFIENCITAVDQFKRKLPILIKRVNCSFYDLEEFLKTGEGIEFLLQVEYDKEKLRKVVCSFEEFKKFAKKRKLKHVLENLIDKIEFKHLFMS